MQCNRINCVHITNQNSLLTNIRSHKSAILLSIADQHTIESQIIGNTIFNDKNGNSIKLLDVAYLPQFQTGASVQFTDNTAEINYDDIIVMAET